MDASLIMVKKKEENLPLDFFFGKKGKKYNLSNPSRKGIA